MKPSSAGILLSCLLLAVSACTASRQAAMPDATTTFVVVRHAEKSKDDARDPSLSEAGRKRALALARLLADAPLTAAHATGYRRTQQTAEPAAQAHGLTVRIYDAQQSATSLATQLLAADGGGTVLVVGHSNTVPDIVSALSGQAVEAIADDEYDRLYRVRIVAGGKPRVELERY